jgi:hypothetical protein
MKRLDRLLSGVKKLVIKFTVSAMPFALVFCMVLSIFGSVTVVQASTIGEEFVTLDSLQNGLIVSINPEQPDSIGLASLGTGQYSLGIINDTQSNVITFAKDNATVSVALSGEVLVYVSDANGEIKIGDFVGVSWLEGIGMKALTNQDQKLLGVALEDFDSTQATDYGAIETNNGNKDVAVDIIKVRLFDKEGSVDAINSSSQVTGLENFANSIAGKSVNPIRILAGALIFIMGIALAGFFAYSSIRGSFISVGRNPMASDSIYRNLTQVSMISVAALVIGAALAYVVLVV